MTVRQSWRLGRRPARDPSGSVLGACIGGSTEALGDQYERFAAERKRLVPRIW